MELSITTPALLFPAISLLMLAYTNRFLALASLIRSLHEKFKKEPEERHIVEQIKNLRLRVQMIRAMQAFGILSFLLCVACMYCIFNSWAGLGNVLFAISVGSFMISLILSFIEITLSVHALEIEIQGMEEITRSGFFTGMLGSREGKNEQ